MVLESKSRKTILLLAALLFALLISRLYKSEHLPGSPVPTPLVVEVLGDVPTPGVHLIDPIKPFIKEAMRAAGLSEAASRVIDAAGPDASFLPLRSGQTVRITKLPADGFRVEVGLMPAAARLVLGEKLDLNSVAHEDLLLIPGMRPNLAAAIVSRRSNRLWFVLDDLQEVPGIGPGLVKRWKDYLEVR
jgi:DNA uptake protein ComE-like DNA-binding protein